MIQDLIKVIIRAAHLNAAVLLSCHKLGSEGGTASPTASTNQVLREPLSLSQVQCKLKHSVICSVWLAHWVWNLFYQSLAAIWFGLELRSPDKSSLRFSGIRFPWRHVALSLLLTDSEPIGGVPWASRLVEGGSPGGISQVLMFWNVFLPPHLWQRNIPNEYQRFGLAKRDASCSKPVVKQRRYTADYLTAQV